VDHCRGERFLRPTIAPRLVHDAEGSEAHRTSIHFNFNILQYQRRPAALRDNLNCRAGGGQQRTKDDVSWSTLISLYGTLARNRSLAPRGGSSLRFC
jgi:hypothetical protein